MKPVFFFSEDIVITPHSVSNELADLLESPTSIGEFIKKTGNHPVSVYETEQNEIYVMSRPQQPMGGKVCFMEGKAA